MNERVTEEDIIKAGWIKQYEFSLLIDVYAKGNLRMMYDASEEVIVWVKEEKE